MVKKIMDESNKGFMKHLGGLELKKISETQYEFMVEVKEIHLNTGKIAHGGFLSTIADTGMGTAAHRVCLLYTSPSPRDGLLSRMPSSA